MLQSSFKVNTKLVSGAIPRFQKTYAQQARSIKKVKKLRISRQQQAIRKFQLKVQEASPSPSQTLKSIRDLKAELLDNTFGTERGLTASSEIRANLSDILAQLESQNPTQIPAEALQNLAGSWKLVYTTSPLAFALLGLNNLPLVSVGDIIQNIDGDTMTVENKIQITVPFSKTSLSTQASFEVKSPKRWNVKTNKGSIETPEIMYDTIEALPNSVTLLGQQVDVTYLKVILGNYGKQLNDIVSQVGNFLSQQPNLTEQILQNAPSTWILTTFLDEDTRVARGDGGAVYVFIKEALPLIDAKPVPQPTKESDDQSLPPKPSKLDRQDTQQIDPPQDIS